MLQKLKIHTIQKCDGNKIKHLFISVNYCITKLVERIRLLRYDTFLKTLRAINNHYLYCFNVPNSFNDIL